MSSQYKVLVTDCTWSIEPERQVLAEIGAEVILAESGTGEPIDRLVSQVDGILTDQYPITGDLINAAERCKAIARYGVGFEKVDLDAATASGIVVTNVPAYCIDEVTDHAMALLLACARKIPTFDRGVKGGNWDRNIGPPMRRIRGKTLGIIGFGRIGRLIVSKAKAFGLEVIVFDEYISQTVVEGEGATQVALPELLARSDFITIHAPLTTETHGLLGEQEFQQMKSTAYVINSARGGIINTVALHRALAEAWIAGAALDVLPEEPPNPDEPLLELENIILTPHVAFLSEESGYDLQVAAATELVRVLAGQIPESVVNPSVLESHALRAKGLRKSLK